MTGAELAEMCSGPWIGTLTCFPGMKAAPQYPMAVERACWQGEPVVMVVAQTRALAEDAAELVEIEWQELPAVVDKETALAATTPVLHADLGDNLAFRKTIESGDVDDGVRRRRHRGGGRPSISGATPPSASNRARCSPITTNRPSG